jgi:hypothetical protein
LKKAQAKFKEELAVAHEMYKKLEFFNDLSKRTPAEIENDPFHNTGHTSGQTSGGHTSACAPDDYWCNHGRAMEWGELDESALTFLTATVPVPLGEDSKFVNLFMKTYSGETTELEKFCDEVQHRNSQRKHDFDQALIWNK